MSLRALIFALLGVPALFGCQADEKAREACAVYRAFYQQIPAPEQQVFYSLSRPDILDVHYQRAQAPTRFTSGMGLMAPDPDAPPPETFDADTSRYFERVGAGPAIELASCFQAAAPRFIELGIDPLELIDAPRSNALAVWTVSSVAISPDEQHALIVGGMLCGGLCGSGAYYLFEKSPAGWTLLGHRRLWVS